MLSHFKTALLLAPHTDDIEFGMGGTLAKLLDQGVNVHCVAFSSCDESLPKGFERGTLRREMSDSLQSIGVMKDQIKVLDFQVRHFPARRQDILEVLIQLRNSLKPDLVFVPASGDIHQDHGVISIEGRRAFKNSCLLGYELVWNLTLADSTCSVQLSSDLIDRKCEAIGFYKSQAGKPYASAEAVRSLARVRGLQSGFEFAESFEVMRWIVR